jgi:hypothetical protein
MVKYPDMQSAQTVFTSGLKDHSPPRISFQNAPFVEAVAKNGGLETFEGSRLKHFYAL